MAMIGFTKHYPLSSRSYSRFRKWLHENHFDRLCGYCFEFNSQLHVEHYVPKSLRPDLSCDPSNLLLACGCCNTCKGEFDPSSGLKNKINDECHLIHNLRREDLAELFQISDDGKLVGSSKRGEWLLILFDLNDPAYVDHRRMVLNMITLLEMQMSAGATDNLEFQADLKFVSRYQIFFWALNIEISPELQFLIDKQDRSTARPKV